MAALLSPLCHRFSLPCTGCVGERYGVAGGRREMACLLNALFWWGWLYVVSVFNFPYAGWLGFFLPENAILALLSGGVVSFLPLASGFCFCLSPKDGITPSGWLLGRARVSFLLKGKVSVLRRGPSCRAVGCEGRPPCQPLSERGGLGGCSPPRLHGASLRTSTVPMSMPDSS